jgi:hypothetical protein
VMLNVKMLTNYIKDLIILNLFYWS